MDWEQRIKTQLEHILQAPVAIGTMSSREWNALAGESDATGSVVKDQVVHFLLSETDGNVVEVLKVEEVLITAAEKQLVEMLLEASRHQYESPTKPYQSLGEDEQAALMVKQWVLQHLENGDTVANVPEQLAARLSFYIPQIPFLLYGEYSASRPVLYSELKKLLESFFETDIVLIPLMEKEWLILCPDSLLTASGSDEKENGEKESLEEALTSICSGLYEMLSNEWVGECHLTIHSLTTPAKTLLSTVQQMRETILIGKTFHVGQNLHLPWDMLMEKLLFAAPEAEKLRFIERVLTGVDYALDSESIATLEQFFSLDCNVSETAKSLYIHRNTLLYRLDKFKQETGRDVRTFQDAVLVKLALLLYKVTKRV